MYLERRKLTGVRQEPLKVDYAMKLTCLSLSLVIAGAVAVGPGEAIRGVRRPGFKEQPVATKASPAVSISSRKTEAILDIKDVTAAKEISLSFSTAVIAGVLLAFNSGFMNGACLAGAIIPGKKQAVAAVTGAWTVSAVSWASGDVNTFYKQLLIILSYAGGSTIASLLDPNPTPFRLNTKAVGPGFLICSALVYFASTKAAAGESTFLIFSLAAIANGLQNSITSVATGNVIRTAHYSGMTSDFGTFLGQYLHGNKANLYKLKINLALCGDFWGGGTIAYIATQQYAASTLMWSAIGFALFGLFVEY